MGGSTTDRAQNQPPSVSQWYMQRPSNDSTEQYSVTGIHTQYGPGCPDYTETRMDPPYTVGSSSFMSDEIYMCSSNHGDDNSVWNAVSENDFTPNADYNREILGTGVGTDDAPGIGYMQRLHSSYSYDSAELEDFYGQLVDIGSRSHGPLELGEELGGSVEDNAFSLVDNAHISTFCWRPYWRT